MLHSNEVSRLCRPMCGEAYASPSSVPNVFEAMPQTARQSRYIFIILSGKAQPLPHIRRQSRSTGVR